MITTNSTISDYCQEKKKKQAEMRHYPYPMPKDFIGYYFHITDFTGSVITYSDHGFEVFW